MRKKTESELLLLLTAAIWGFAFVAQKQGMDSLDAFTYNGIRFALGALFVGLISLKTGKQVDSQTISYQTGTCRTLPWVLGVVLFIAASLQQVGIVWTTAGNAGFITSLYIVIVPLLGVYRKQRISLALKAAIVLAVVGLYLINSNQSIEISLGNGIVLVSALFWGIHVQMIDKYTSRYETFYLAFTQFAICAILSFFCGLVYYIIFQPGFLMHKAFWAGVYQAAFPILYGGFLSVGVAYTLQVYAQKRTSPSNAAVILCMEAVFALIGGWWLLSESISMAKLEGTALLLGAMLLSMIKNTKRISFDIT